MDEVRERLTIVVIGLRWARSGRCVVWGIGLNMVVEEDGMDG